MRKHCLDFTPHLYVKPLVFIFVFLACVQVSLGQNVVKPQAVGTETWTVAKNTAILADEEVEYYASANIAVLFGQQNKWEAATQRLLNGGDTTYYIRSQNNPSRQDNGKLSMNSLPDKGNYFHLKFFVGGKISIRFAYSSQKNPRKLYCVYSENGSNHIADSLSAVVSSNTYAVSSDKNDSYVQLPATGSNGTKAAIKGGTLTFHANAGEEYWLWISSTEEFSFGGFTFQVEADNRFNVWEPDVHAHVIYGKPKNADTPSGAENITMMYGGWLNHANSVKVATGWDKDKKEWKYSYNGTPETQYDGKTDKWEKAVEETELNALDQFTHYTSGCGNDPTDGKYRVFESNKGVSTLPCRGTYYKFEPQKDGYLTVYVRQAAKQPLFFVDESGNPQTSDEVVAGQADAQVSKQAGSSYVSSALSAVRYSFEIKAGKTYFLFQNNAQLGFYGFTFGADDTSETPVTLSPSEAKAVDNAKVTYTRTFLKDVWNTITLPFSMNEAEVREAFGDGVEVSQFKEVDNNNTVQFVQGYYHLIEAGMPYIIKPSKDVTEFTTEACVTMTATQPVAVESNGYAFTGVYEAGWISPGDYYFTVKDGKSGIATPTKATSTGEFRAYLKKVDSQASALRAAFQSTETGIGRVETIGSSKAHGLVYNLNGAVVATGGDLTGLGHGIYVVDGKKICK